MPSFFAISRVNLILFSLCLVLITRNLTAQVLFSKDKDIRPNNTYGIIIIYSQSNGSLFMNGIYLTEVHEMDTLYMVNAVPGYLKVRLSMDTSSVETKIHILKGKVTELEISDNNISIKPKPYRYDQAVALIRGTKFVALARKKFYNLTYLGVFNFIIDGPYLHNYDPLVRFFNSFSTINGYQFAPGFCLGFGISYNFYDIYVSSPNGTLELKNVSFMPVYADIRAHLPGGGRRAIPFFKFNLGYNILLTRKDSYQVHAYYNEYYYYKVNKGGILVSPGMGLRIIVSDLVQITTAIEYSFEKSTLYSSRLDLDNDHFHEYDQAMKFHFLRIKMGIGFQY